MRTLLFVLSTAIILFACSNPEEKKDSKVEEKTGAQQPGQGEKTNMNVTINNVAIEYDECGQGDTTLLFVHGWCINKDYWDDQKKYFCDKYKVVTLDLPGFGKSGKNRTNWTFEEYTDDIQKFIKEKKLRNVILIGHSMSGDILLLMDTKYPESVIGIVGIDNLKKPGIKNTIGQTEEMESFFAMLNSNFAGTVESYTKEYLLPYSADISIVNRVVKDFKSSDSVIAIKVLRSLADVSQKERDMMQQLRHKLYLVNSDQSLTEIDSLKIYCKASAEVVYVKGTGHYPMIEKPVEFNAALERVIRMILSQPAPVGG
jgi:pimeloyl-ACP methyl ester carboxylesterase